MSAVKIINRPPELDAIQYDGTNEAEVAAFIGFLFKPSSVENPEPAVYDPVARYLVPIPVGSWVVMTGFNIAVLDPTGFELQYTIVSSS